MKPVFKCDYCDKMGTEEEIREHEPVCTDNYDRKSCYTCVYKKTRVKDGKWFFECEANEKIPEGKIFEFCKKYERKEKRAIIKSFEIEGFYDLGEAWHEAVELAIDKCEDDERIESIKLISDQGVEI